MKLSIPGLPGVYYDTDAESTAISTALTLAGRRAPKPHGYAAQVLPILWSLDVDLREVPSDHPIQFLHPEGARSLDELPRDERVKFVARDADFVLRFAGEVNDRTETALSEFVGEANEQVRTALSEVVGEKDSAEEIVIEIEDGSVESTPDADGETLPRDGLDLDLERENLEGETDDGFGGPDGEQDDGVDDLDGPR